MKTKNALLLVSLSALLGLAACGKEGKSFNRSVDSGGDPIIVDSKGGNSVYNSEQTSQVDPVISHDSSGYTLANFQALIDGMAEQINQIHTINWEKVVYISATGRTEHETQNNVYYKGEQSPILEAEEELNYVASFDDLTSTDLRAKAKRQSFAKDGSLCYYDIVDKDYESTAGRLSRLAYSRDGRYSNLFTYYSSSFFLDIIREAQPLVHENYAQWFGSSSSGRVLDPVIDTKDNVVTLTVSGVLTYTDSQSTEFLRVNIDKDSGALLSIEIGWNMVSAATANSKNPTYISRRVDRISNISFGGREDFSGTLFTPADVEAKGSRGQIQGKPAAKKIDYTQYGENITGDDAKKILANFEAYGEGTSSSKTTFEIDEFVDPANSTSTSEDDDQLKVAGTLKGEVNSQLYGDSIKVDKGTLTLLPLEEDRTEANKDGTKIAYESQAIAKEEGIYKFDSFNPDGSPLLSHEHHLGGVANEKTYLSPNAIYRSDALEPISLLATWGIADRDASSDPEQQDAGAMTTYSISGVSLKRSGTTLTGTAESINVHNAFGNYITYSFSFTVKDYFLASYTLTTKSEALVDSSDEMFVQNATYQFENVKGSAKDVNEAPDLFEEGDLEESETLALHETLFYGSHNLDED